MNLDNRNGKIGKFTNLWKVNNMVLNNQMAQGETMREIRKYLQINENKSNIKKLKGQSKSGSKGEIYRCISRVTLKNKKDFK